MRNPLPIVVDKLLEATVVGSFTRLGFAARSWLEGWTDPTTLAGRSVLITGATSGLGFEAAAKLASLGAAVTFVARDETRAIDALRLLRARSSDGLIDYILADTGDLGAMRRIAETVASRGALDVLIHNAGAISPSYHLSPQGFEVTVASQLLGPFLLTKTLIPSLAASSPGRVVTVSSGGAYSQKFEVAALETPVANYDGVRAYAAVKRAQLVLNREWMHHVSGREVVFHAMHPGWSDTPGLAASLPKFHSLLGPALRTPAQGADTLVWLAGARETPETTGHFWMDRHRRFEHKVPWTLPRDAAQDQVTLWDWCVERTAGY